MYDPTTVVKGLRSVSAAGLVPIPKRAGGFVAAWASEMTNPISILRFALRDIAIKGDKLGLGGRLFGALGRVNAVVWPAVMVADIADCGTRGIE